MAISATSMAIEVDNVLSLTSLHTEKTLAPLSVRLPNAALPRGRIDASGMPPNTTEAKAAIVATKAALAELALQCSVRQNAFEVPLGVLPPGGRSEDFNQAQAFQVICPAPASYRLIAVNAQGVEIQQGVVPVLIGGSNLGQLRITIDGHPLGRQIQHNGVLPKTHHLAVELWNESGRAVIPATSGVVSLAEEGLSLALRSALPGSQ